MLRSLTDNDFDVRCVYMKLYKSWFEGDAYLPAPFVGNGIQHLIDAGHAESVPHGYRMTEEGVNAWAQMNAEMLHRPEAKIAKSAKWQELKKRLSTTQRTNVHVTTCTSANLITG